MRFRWLAGACCYGLLAGAVGFVSGQQAETADAAAEQPRKIGLTERATGQLVQLDVTVKGPRAAITDLGVEDFELVVNGSFIEGFLVDGLCGLPQAEPAQTQPSGADQADATPVAPAAPTRVRASYLFYFDQHHLTAAGRQNSLDISRSLIPELIKDGNRAMIVSAGEELETFATLTGEHDSLFGALDRIEGDRRQWDLYPYEEEVRVQRVAEEFYKDTERAVSLARMYQREERYHTDRALRLFSLVLGRMAELDPPKAVVYFADTMRVNSGAHYLSFFGQAQREHDPVISGVSSAMELDAFAAGTAYDRVVEAAAAHGVRLYTVQAQGLTTSSMLMPARPRGAEANTRHIADAQDALVGLAMETGGQAFVNGVPAVKIARRITADLSCVYLLSFEPTGLAVDQALPVLVRVKRPKVEAHARGTLMVQSESSRVTSRLMAAFTAPDAANADWPLRGVIIPTGYKKGRFSSLVQVAVPGSPLAQTEWDLGFSLVSRGKVRQDDSSRVAVPSPGVPVVLEKELTFEPGEFEIIMVAREINSDQLATAQIEGAWPDPDDAPGTVGPVAVLQPSNGAFLRGGELRGRGALGRDEVQLAHTDLPTVLVGLVCRSRSAKARLRVERRLVGADSAEFPPIQLDLADERCAQIRDSIPAGVMTPGGFAYEIRLFDGENEIAFGSREFSVAGPDSASANDG